MSFGNDLAQTAAKDLPDAVLEQMLFAELVNNEQFANRIAPIFKSDWFSDDELRPMSNMVVQWRKRFSTSITTDLLSALLNKYVQSHPGCGINVPLCIQKFNRALALDLGGLDTPCRVATINEFIKKNILKEAIVNGAKILSQGGVDGVVEGCMQVLEDAERLTLDESEGSLTYNAEAVDYDKDTGEGMLDHFDAISNLAQKLSTGWPTLDLYTNGGFLKDKFLGIVMGQAGLGKTVALANLGYNFLQQNLRVLVFTMELSKDMYGRRFDSLISNIDLDDLGPLVDTAKQRIHDFFKAHPGAELVIKEFPPKGASTNTFNAFIKNLAKEKGKNWKPDVIIVDYLNIVETASGKQDTMFEEGIRASEELRAMSYRWEAPVITAVQTTTEGMDTEELGMKNISQSRGIAHTADFIMAIYNSAGGIRGKIIKSRLGSVKEGQNIMFHRDENTLRMTDMQGECIEADGANNGTPAATQKAAAPNATASANELPASLTALLSGDINSL